MKSIRINVYLKPEIKNWLYEKAASREESVSEFVESWLNWLRLKEAHEATISVDYKREWAKK